MKFNRTTALAAATIACVSLQLVLSADSQAQATLVQATQVAGFGLPPGQTAAPNTPGGGVVVGSNFYSGDGAQGFRHWKPADPANPDPINNGILVFDPDISKSLGGGTACFLFCSVGQIAYDGNQTVYLAVYDKATGQPFSLRSPGINRVVIDPVQGFLEWQGVIAPKSGLAGNETTSVALGPDGNLYVGFLKNGNVVRIVNPLVDPNNDPNKTQVVQSVGTAPNGRPVRSMAFVGNDLYLGSTESLSVIRNAVATACQGGCNGALLQDGFVGSGHVGIAADGINRVYVSIVGHGVWRYTVSSNAMTQISIGGLNPARAVNLFAFVGGHSNLLQLDRLGNLWIGDDTSDGTVNFSGRIWRISSGALSSVP